MNRIVDWYWKHGTNRPPEWSISTSGLNSIMGAVNRNDSIAATRKSDNGKACVAFWGPSQSGKSSLLSHYIDGKYDTDLALTWDPNQKVRFSTYQGGAGVDLNCVVFNPFNCAMDASGLVTRFYLPSDQEVGQINPETPVEVFFANRKQVLHAIAVGFRMECQESENPWGLDQLRKMISNPSVKPDRLAFEFLYDVCDVCENMARESTRYREFANSPRLRQQILASSYADNINQALELAAYLLWDGSQRLTDLYKRIIDVRDGFDMIRGNAIPDRVFASMEVAALLEDIGVLAFYNANKNKLPSAEAKRRIDALNSICMITTPRGILLTCGSGRIKDKINAYEVEVEQFGLIQALIGELKIPLRRTNCSEAKPFFDFLERCDLLDIPGVTNKASGEALGVENQIDLSKDVDDSILLSRVYKSGKTLSIVYRQAETCSIDSFVVFVDLERAGGISRPTTLTNGLKAWLSPYGFKSFTANAPLKIYLNCSLFGKLMDKVVAAVNGGGLKNYCEKAAVLEFTKTSNVDCFFTTNCFARCSDKSKKHYFEEDSDFKSAFLRGKGKEALDAIFADELGTDYMFTRLASEVSNNSRLSNYNLIESQDLAKLKNELSRILPSGQGAVVALRKEVVKKIIDRVGKLVSIDTPSQVRKLAAFVKNVFFVDENLLDPVPKTPHKLHDEDLKTYLIHQTNKWVSSRKEVLVGDANFSWLVNDDEAYPFLEAVSTIDVKRVSEKLRTDFWDADFWNHNQKNSRAFLATILNNCFLWGDYERCAYSIGANPYDSLYYPFLERLKQLSSMVYASDGDRPSDLDGDDELLAIASSLGIA